MNTAYGQFRLDFVLEVKGLRVGIECDGEPFHDRVRDMYRDAAILGSHQVSEIVRFRGTDLFNSPSDCVLILSRMYDRFFDARARSILHQLASCAAREVVFDRESDVIEFVGPFCEDNDDERERRREIAWRCWTANHVPTSWQQLYRAMVHVNSRDLDEVAEELRKRRWP